VPLPKGGGVLLLKGGLSRPLTPKKLHAPKRQVKNGDHVPCQPKNCCRLRNLGEHALVFTRRLLQPPIFPKHRDFVAGRQAIYKTVFAQICPWT